MDRLQNLLTHVLLTTKKNAELLDANGGRFNLFQIFGVDHYENTHSAILAEFLNPHGTHGLKHTFLVDFVYNIILKGSNFEFDCENAIVRTEVDTGNGRVDILIKDQKNHAIIVENKIYAFDQSEQLKRYNQYAVNKFGKDKFIILYLTLDGTEASKDSGEGVDYNAISYSNDIINWLELCVNKSSRFPLVRESIIQYINHLKRLTNQDMDTKNKNEIVKILSSNKENIEAAFTIFENIGSLKDYIIAEYLNPQINEIAEDLNLGHHGYVGREKWKGFRFNIPEWKYFDIYFEFDRNDATNFQYMYRLKDAITEYPENTVTKLKPLFAHHNSNTTLPCGYSDMVGEYFNWNIKAYLAIISGEMKEEIKSVVLKLINMAKKLDLEM